MFHRSSLAVIGLAFVAGPIGFSSSAQAGDDPFADEVISFTQGVGGSPAYNIPASALGSPDRISGECFGGSDVISAFSQAYCPDEIVSIGAGGELVVKFNTPVTDDPNNLYGIDLLLFGNAGFIDSNYPSGVVDGVFAEGGAIHVSADGINWIETKGLDADGLWPTVGFNDAGAYVQTPGSSPSDFTRPVDPSLTLDDFMGLNNDGVLELYRGSGGGTGIDLAAVNLPAVSYVRISLPPDAQFISPEIDAVADVSPRQPGDVNLDGIIDVADLLLVIGAWGAAVPGGPPADFDLNSVVDVQDLLVVISHWGR